MTNPLVSVIILTWNGRQDIEACLQALLAQTYDNAELLVVDNASTDGTADWVADHVPQVKLIRNAENLGFSAGNNIGLTAATGQVFVLLNQDTVVEAGWLAALVNRFATDDTIGIVGGKALFPDGTIQHAGGKIDERGNSYHHGQGEADTGQFDQGREVDYITGATLAISRAAYEAVGGLDEGFSPAYWEDADWCYRVRQAGYKIVYEPAARLIHNETSALADQSHQGNYLPQRNRLRFVLKHWPLEKLTGSFLPAEKAWLDQLGEGNEAIANVMARSYLHHLLHLADLLEARQTIHPTAFAEADQIADLLLTLRRATTLDLVERSSVVQPAAADPEAAVLLEQLHQGWDLKEYQFQSQTPLVGPLIARLRSAWYQVAAAWVIRTLMGQQSQVNARLLSLLIKQERRLTVLERQRLALAEYLVEQQRELTDFGYVIAEIQVETSQSQKETNR